MRFSLKLILGLSIAFLCLTCGKDEEVGEVSVEVTPIPASYQKLEDPISPMFLISIKPEEDAELTAAQVYYTTDGSDPVVGESDFVDVDLSSLQEVDGGGFSVTSDSLPSQSKAVRINYVVHLSLEQKVSKKGFLKAKEETKSFGVNQDGYVSYKFSTGEDSTAPDEDEDEDPDTPTETDDYWSDVALLMHMNGSNNSTTFTEEKGLSMTPSANYVISTGDKKFGTASGYFPGTSSSAISLPASSNLQLAGDFTIEFWIKPDAMDPLAVIVGSDWASVNHQIQINQDNTGKIGILIDSWCSTDVTQATTSADWQHIALTREGSTVRVYYNGNKVGADIACTATTVDFSNGSIGALKGQGIQLYTGYMDDLRITKGVARYTGSSFTIPTSAFPNQ